MLVELILKELPKLDLEGYEKIEFSNGVVFSNPVEKRVEIVLKKHPDGRVSVFTDKSEIIKQLLSLIIDMHAK